MMLVSLRIANFLLIEDTRIGLHRGLNVLTGETGAGKSIIVDALSLLLGERGSSDIVRDPEQDALIEAEFALSPHTPTALALQALLDEAGIPFDGETLLIHRRLSAEGRSRIYLNNTQCLLKKLKETGDCLIDLHGQHDHQSLLHKGSYIGLLDSFGAYQSTRLQYTEAYNYWTQTLHELQSLEEDERERKRREATLRFQIEEIAAAALQPDEEAQIEPRLHVIQHAERLAEKCNLVLQAVTSGDHDRPSILDELDRLETVLATMLKLDPSLASLVESWQGATISLRETTRELEAYALDLEFDPEELNQLHKRHFLIRDLEAKYGATIPDILHYQDQLTAELEKIEHTEEERERLLRQEDKARALLIDHGLALHAERVAIAETLSRSVTQELQSLGMEKANFTIQVNLRTTAHGLDIGQETLVTFGPEGADDVDFLVTTIPDRPPRPLREVASGGEVSRIMLALKCVFSGADPVPMMVFDEIDVGVGGKTADVVAERLVSLARHKQVLCITHLPQIASRADRNLQVHKTETNGRMFSSVRHLEGKEKETELARMLGGEENAASKRFARELLKSSKKAKADPSHKKLRTQSSHAE